MGKWMVSIGIPKSLCNNKPRIFKSSWRYFLSFAVLYISIYRNQMKSLRR